MVVVVGAVVASAAVDLGLAEAAAGSVGEAWAVVVLMVPPVTLRRVDTRLAASTAQARAWEEPAGMGAMPARGQAGG